MVISQSPAVQVVLQPQPTPLEAFKRHCEDTPVVGHMAGWNIIISSR